jgi:outer membrane lipoprotein-sorting protein
VGDAMVEGVPVKLVAVDNIKRLDREITREILAIDARNMNLRQVTMYAGDTKVTQHTFTKFQWNPKVDSKTFSI